MNAQMVIIAEHFDHDALCVHLETDQLDASPTKSNAHFLLRPPLCKRTIVLVELCVLVIF